VDEDEVEGGDIDDESSCLSRLLSLLFDVEKSSSVSRRSPLNFGGRDLHVHMLSCKYIRMVPEEGEHNQI
jgi:hypothetical protein